MKIIDIKLHPHDSRLESINTLHVTSRELADLVRELENDSEFKNLKGTFTMHRKEGRTIYLDFEF